MYIVLSFLKYILHAIIHRKSLFSEKELERESASL